MSLPLLFSEKPPRSLSEFELIHDPKDKQSRLGIGSFATVKLCREKKTGRYLALKMVDIDASKNRSSDLHNLRMEVNVHRRINHPNIIDYYGYAQEGHKIFIVLDYANRGNLYSHIHKTRGSLPPEEIFRFFHQTCLAIQYLHQKDIMHRDIKPENLLLDKDLNIKLCDFGWSAERIRDKRTTFCGTYEYMAPEIVYKRAYDYRVDTWSLGVLLYELIHKEAPYKGRTINEIMQSLSKGVITFKSGVDPQAKDLIQKILRVTPNDRLSISQILSHPWVKAHVGPPESPKNIFDTFKIEPPSTKVKPASQGLEREHLDSASSSTANTVRSKSRKISTTQVSSSGSNNLRMKRTNEEPNSEAVLRHHTKSSCSIGKAAGGIIDHVEERKPTTPLEICRKRKILGSKISSGNIKKSLHSIISSSNFTPISDQDSIDYAVSPFSSAISPTSGHPKTVKNATPAHNRILSSADAPISTGYSSSVNGYASTNPSLTLDICEPVLHAAMGHTTTPVGFRQMKTPDLTKRVRTVSTLNGSNNFKLLTASHNENYNYDTSSARAKQHPKTLTVIKENVNPRRPLTEARSNNSSMSNRSLYKGARHLVSPRHLDVSTPGIETTKAVSGDFKRIISPMVSSTRADFVGRLKTEMPKLDGRSKDTGLTEHNSNLMAMNRRPDLTAEKRVKSEKENVSGFSFNNFMPTDSYRAKLVGAAIHEDNYTTKIAGALMKERANSSKENKTIDRRLLKSSGNLDLLFTPREIQSIRYKN